MTNDDLAKHRRHQRRVDPRAHRHPQRHIAERRRTHLRPRHRRRAAGAGARRHRSRRHRSHHLRHRHAGPHLPGHRRAHPGRPRRHQGRRLRRAGGVLGLRLRAAVADNFLKTGQFKRALVVGAETFSRILDWEDRGTCVLFGDGAGAVVLEAQTQPAAATTAASWPPASAPTAASRTCSTSTAAPARPRPPAICA